MSEPLHTLPDAPMITICAWCVEVVAQPAGVRISHGICEKHRAEMSKYMTETMTKELKTAGVPAESKAEI